jgi:hypothetical protein
VVAAAIRENPKEAWHQPANKQKKKFLKKEAKLPGAEAGAAEAAKAGAVKLSANHIKKYTHKVYFFIGRRQHFGDG